MMLYSDNIHFSNDALTDVNQPQFVFMVPDRVNMLSFIAYFPIDFPHITQSFTMSQLFLEESEKSSNTRQFSSIFSVIIFFSI